MPPDYPPRAAEMGIAWARVCTERLLKVRHHDSMPKLVYEAGMFASKIHNL